MDPRAYEEMAATQDRHWWFQGRRAILESVMAALPLPGDCRILEIGAGTGGNLGMLSRFGQVSAVEMNDFARGIASSRAGAGIEILPGRLPDDLPYAAGTFDLVCLFDVLEHVEDDGRALAAIRPLLRPGGHLLLTVPAHPWLWSRHDRHLHHVRRYRRRELVDKISGAGFGDPRTTYFNSLLFPVAVATRLVDRLHSAGGSIGTGMPGPWVNACLTSIFASERFLLPRCNLGFGISLLSVARVS